MSEPETDPTFAVALGASVLGLIVGDALEKREAAGALPEADRLAETLALHYITAIECDHDAKTDTVRCNCSVWTGTPQPSVGAAVRQWVDHVLEFAALSREST